MEEAMGDLNDGRCGPTDVWPFSEAILEMTVFVYVKALDLQWKGYEDFEYIYI